MKTDQAVEDINITSQPSKAKHGSLFNEELINMPSVEMHEHMNTYRQIDNGSVPECRFENTMENAFSICIENRHHFIHNDYF